MLLDAHHAAGFMIIDGGTVDLRVFLSKRRGGLK